LRELNEGEAAASADIDNGDAAAEPDGVQELQAERSRPQGEIVVDESGTGHDQKFLTMALPQQAPRNTLSHGQFNLYRNGSFSTN
jgi:hypothetical protein